MKDDPQGSLYTLEEAALATAGRLPWPCKGVGFSSCAIDSRTVAAGECFVAVKGERFDGHDFVGRALRAGASSAMVERIPADVGDKPLLVVENTLEAFQMLARHARRKWPMTVVGITGSMGKTTTKELAALALSAGFSVKASEGNLNSQLGLPLCMLRRRPEHNAGVFEMGMSRAGEIARLVGVAQPSVGVLTNIAAVHLEYFESIEQIAEAKKELIDGLPANGIAVLNADDPRVLECARGFKGRKITYAVRSGKADVSVSDVRTHEDGTMSCTVFMPEPKEGIPMRFGLPGAHNLSNALAALACAFAMGVEPAEAIERIGQFRATQGRSEVTLLPGGATLIDDSYNSNPTALLEAARAAAAMKKAGGRLMVVSGDMLELGPSAEKLHHESGAALADAGVDVLVAIGALSGHLVAGARTAGLSNARLYEDAQAASIEIATLVEPGDIVLIKGSRGIRTDIVAARIKKGVG